VPRLTLSPGSRVLIDLRAAGLLRGLAHDPTLSAVPDPFSVELPDPGGHAALTVRFAVSAIAPPSGMSRGDTEKMRENMLGRDVLDAARWPTITFTGAYEGSLDAGRVTGELDVRGSRHPLAIDVRATTQDGRLVAEGAWEGRLTQLGVKPFRALLGAIQLADWLRLRLDVRFVLERGGE
jgi:hypothetical protein